MLTLSSASPRALGALGASEAAEASECLDDSLTSLQWLQDFSILGDAAPHPPGSDAPASPQAADPACWGSAFTPGKPTAAAYSRLQQHGLCPDDVDFKTNPHVKPPYSYATLICMAMKESPQSKIPLSAIYGWITDNFCYYRHADPTWQNSIRHNLSLNKCFIKVPRQKDEPGKGGFWKIDPFYAERLLSGAYKKRRMPPVHINPALQSRFGINLPPRAPALLSVKTECQRLLWEFEDITGANQSWDPHLADATMLGAWPVVRGRGGHKRKSSYSSGGVSAKAARRSTSPLLSADEPTEEGPLKGDFDWDALLDSALSGELSLDEGEPLSPAVKEEDLTVRGTHIQPVPAPSALDDAHGSSDFEEETYLASSFLESPWADERSSSREDFLSSSREDFLSSSREDFLSSSSHNLDQLFGLEVSLEEDPSSRMDALL